MAVRSVVVLGGSGFIARVTVAALVRQGDSVVALARSERCARTLDQLGAVARLVDYERPAQWLDVIAGTHALIDLRQPPLPGRLTLPAVRQIAQLRVAATRSLTQELIKLDVGEGRERKAEQVRARSDIPQMKKRGSRVEG